MARIFAKVGLGFLVLFLTLENSAPDQQTEIILGRKKFVPVAGLLQAATQLPALDQAQERISHRQAAPPAANLKDPEGKSP